MFYASMFVINVQYIEENIMYPYIVHIYHC